jgi:hypothetical protein
LKGDRSTGHSSGERGLSMLRELEGLCGWKLVGKEGGGRSKEQTLQGLAEDCES